MIMIRMRMTRMKRITISHMISTLRSCISVGNQSAGDDACDDNCNDNCDEESTAHKS